MGRMTAGITRMKTPRSAVSDAVLPLPAPGPPAACTRLPGAPVHWGGVTVPELGHSGGAVGTSGSSRWVPSGVAGGAKGAGGGSGQESGVAEAEPAVGLAVGSGAEGTGWGGEELTLLQPGQPPGRCLCLNLFASVSLL